MTESATTTTAAAERVETRGHPSTVETRPSRAAAFWASARIGVDCAMLLAAAVAAQLGARAAGVPGTPARWLLLYGLLVIAVSSVRGAYAWRIRLQAIDDLCSAIITTAVVGTAVLSLRVLIGDDAAVGDQLLRLWAFAAVYVGAGRVALDRSQLNERRRGELLKPTLIVGAGRVGEQAAKRLLDHPEFGLRPVGFLDNHPPEGVRSLPVLGASWDLEEVAAGHGIQQVIFAFSATPDDVLLGLAKRCDDLGLDISFVPRLYERMSERVTVESIGGLPLLSARRVPPKGWAFGVKHVLDRLFALLITLLTLPLLLAAALGVRLSMGRPLFFRQLRVGRDGRTFEMLKFRTMSDRPEEPADASDLAAADRAPGGVEGSDRRTRLGTLLRATSIDELPQLINVLKGEMSLVGPRPERPEFVELFEERVRGYGDRHRVKAGITGWAQVHGLRGKTSISERAEWDNYYIENWSLWLDFKILVMTLFAVVGGSRSVE